MLVMVVNERQDDWDVHLPHVEFAYNNSTSAATRLVPNEVHMNRLPRLPLTIFEHRYARGHQASPATTWTTATSTPTDNSVRLRWFASTTTSLSPAWSAVFQRSSTHSNNSVSTPSVAEYGSTTPPLPFTRAPNPAPTQRFSRKSYRSTGQVLSRF